MVVSKKDLFGSRPKNGLLFLALESTQLISVLPRLGSLYYLCVEEPTMSQLNT